jgi:hypothetical protein
MAFPSTISHDSRGYLSDPAPGMTYRMWLIGKILAGLSPNLTSTTDFRFFTMRAIQQADDAIAKLDAEKEVPDAAD